MDTNTPIEKLLMAAEASLTSAISLRQFGKPALAFKDFIIAMELATETIPRHRDYTSFQSDRRKLGDRHRTLLKRLRQEDPIFEGIKNNLNEAGNGMGSSPARQDPKANGTAASNDIRQTNGSIDTSHHEMPTNGNRAGQINYVPLKQTSETSSAARKKPPVHPKPAGLHGNILSQESSNSPASTTKSSQDLAARFASLRAGTTNGAQDARIRTQAIPFKPQGPREMPPSPTKTSPRSLPSIQSAIPDLPRVPDAIYSPARGSVSSEAAELPSSNARGMFSRTNSINAYSGPSASLTKPSSGDDYFAHASAAPVMKVPTRTPARPVPGKESISVHELVELQQLGSKVFSILLVDVRSRDDFDHGHIMTHSIICVEPEILQRPDLSAEDIVEAMVIAPTIEQQLLQSRHDCDLIVFYDQSTKRIDPSRRNDPAMMPLLHFRAALDHYDYVGNGQTPPQLRLLEGGLDAWINVMGSALKTSSTLGAVGVRPRRTLRNRAPSILSKPKPRRPTRAIQSTEEAQKWEASLRDAQSPAAEEQEAEDGDSLEFVRTTSDFMRRFPAVSAQESMLSPIHEKKQPVFPSHRPTPSTDIYHSIPVPPTRPAPAVPRPSYTGLQDSDDLDHAALAKRVRSDTKARPRAGGLKNPGNWCYANSSIQSLFGSAGFSDELMSGEWQQLYQSPQKADEKILPPQLLTKIMANLFHWMSNPKAPFTDAGMLMRYSYHINSKGPNGSKKEEGDIFGGRNQQDAQEYMSFLITEIHDETNTKRDCPGEAAQPVLGGKLSVLQGAKQYWEEHSKRNASLIDKYWRGLDVSVVICSKCKHTTTKYQVFDLLILNTPQGQSVTTLEDMLADAFNVQELEDYRCDGCGEKGFVRKETSLARLPDLLCVVCSRFADAGRKIMTRIDFPVKNLDLTPYFIPTIHPPSSTRPSADRHFTGPFSYDAYAVIQHKGAGLSSGHYISVIKNELPGSTAEGPVSTWRVANDSRVQSLEVGADRGHPGVKMLSSHGGFLSFLTFYSRNRG